MTAWKAIDGQDLKRALVDLLRFHGLKPTEAMKVVADLDTNGWALAEKPTAEQAFALRMKSGHWVGIWNDRETAELMRSKYRDGDKYEIVEFNVPTQKESK